MLKRVRDQRMEDITPGQFSVKLRPGGLFELEYLLSCFSILRCIEKPHLANAGFDALVGEIERQYGDETQKALSCLRALQLEIRLFGRDDQQFEELPQPVLAHVLITMNCGTLNELMELLDHSLNTTASLLAQLFEESHWQGLADWKEGRVNWL